MYLYFIIGIIFGIATILVFNWNELKINKIGNLLMFIIPNIVLWPVVILIFLYTTILKNTDMVKNFNEFVMNVIKEVEDEEERD